MAVASSYDVRQGTLSHSQILLLQQRLVAELPYTLPLARRIEFHLGHPISPTSRIFVAAATATVNTVDPAGRNKAQDEGAGDASHDWLESWLREGSAPETAAPWLAAHIDLSNQGQTQVWVYASWEHPDVGYFSSSVADLPPAAEDTSATASKVSSISTTTDDEDDPLAQAHEDLFSTLFRYILTQLVPHQSSTPNDEWLELQRTGKFLSVPYSRSKAIFGTVHEVLWRYFDNAARTRTDPGYLKYVFSFPSPESDGAAGHDDLNLPDGYYLADMRREHLQMVLDRTPIPRTLNTLIQMESVGLFFKDNPTPIGWGFLSKDGSISSLHTEVEHRGKNLAVTVGKALLLKGSRTSLSRLGVYYGHADSSQVNIPSRRVMEKIGGLPRWRISWTEIDLDIWSQMKSEQ
ncbi:hypothetical protein LTR84_002625 [Exophiala bonariae]|uniref:FR47-like domain-containing protein n=1 Tax=Exophiala bonariae TaxID=1690606 RepID=A0AAV9NCB5_9EURO|nr:hypothetical protein LTR84_002625 [Exophiala bonariae]